MTNNINIDASAITSRVDALQQELIQIKQGLPSAPEWFSNPVPVSLPTGQNLAVTPDFSGLDLEAIADKLDLIRVATETLLTVMTPPPMPEAPSPFAPVQLPANAVTADGWNVTVPQNLSAATDGNSNTSTTFGRLMGGGNIAWFQIDFGENLFAFLARVEYKLRMAPGSEGGNLDFFVRVGVTNVFNEATPVAGVTAFQPGVSENVRSLTAVLSNRYGWIGIRDNGGGQGQLSIVDVKAWEIAI